MKHQFEIEKNWKYVQGENNFANFEKKITIKDDFGNYDCDKEFIKIENGILRMKFVLKNEGEKLWEIKN